MFPKTFNEWSTAFSFTIFIAGLLFILNVVGGGFL